MSKLAALLTRSPRDIYDEKDTFRAVAINKAN